MGMCKVGWGKALAVMWKPCFTVNVTMQAQQFGLNMTCSIASPDPPIVVIAPDGIAGASDWGWKYLQVHVLHSL
jgi:hypothetical protein